MADKNFKYGFIITGDSAQAQEALRKVDKDAKKLNTTVTSTTSTMDKFRKTLAPITSITIFGYMASRAANMALNVEKAAQSVVLLDRRMDYLTGDALALDKVTEAAYELGVGFTDLGGTVGRFAVATKNVFSVDEILEWNSAIILSAKAVGTTTQEAIAGVRQLSQALSKGKLDGDEFRSVVENLPALAVIFRDIAEEMGQNYFDMAEKGLFTTDLMVEAMTRLVEVSADIPKIVTHTIEAEFARVSDQWALLLAHLNEGDSVFRNMAASVAGFLKGLNGSTEALDAIKFGMDAFFKSAEFLLTGGVLYLGIMALNKLFLIMEARLVAVMWSYSAMGASSAAFLALATGPAGWALLIAGLVTAVKYSDDLTKSFYRLIGVQAAMHDESVNELIETTAQFRRQKEHIEAQILAEMLLEETNENKIKYFKKNLEYAKENLKVLEDQHRAYIKSFEDQYNLNNGLREGADANQHYHAWLANVGSQAEVTKESIAKYNKSLEESVSLTKSLRTPQEIYNDTIARYLFLLNNAHLPQETFNRGVTAAYGTLLKATTATEKLTKAVKENEKEANEFEVTWNRAIERLDNGFADMWGEFVRGSISAMDFVKEAAYDFLAEMIHAFTTKKIVASFSATLAGGAASAAGVPGTDGGGMPSLSNLSSLSNMASSGAGFVGTAVDYGMGAALGSVGASTAFTAAGAGAAQAGMLAAQTAAFGTAGTTATVSALGGVTAAGIGSAAMMAVPYVGLALAAAYALGAFDSDSDVTPDMSIWTGGNKDSKLLGSGGNDISFDAGSRYGGIGVMTQHDAFESDDAAAAFYEGVVTRLNSLDEAIFQAVDDGTNAAIEAVSGKNWETSQKFEEGGSIESTMTERFDRIFGAMDNSLEKVYDAMKDRGQTGDEAAASTLMLNANTIILKDTFEALNLKTLDTSAASMFFVENLAEVAGGFGQLTSKLSFYHANFFSATEQYNMILEANRKIIRASGIENIHTSELLRKYIEGLDESGESYAELLDAALELAPALVAAENAMDGLAAIAEAEAAEIQKIANEQAAIAEAEAAERQRIAYEQGAIAEAARQKKYYEQAAIAEAEAAALKATADAEAAALKATADALTEVIDATIDVAQTLVDYVGTSLVEAFEKATIASKSLYEQYGYNLSLISDAGNAFDYSADSLNEMTALIETNRGLEIGLLTQIKTISESITDMTEGYAEKWMQSTLGEQDLYNYNEQKAYGLYDELINETDPVEIDRIAKEIGPLLDSMWNNLPDEGKLEKLADYTAAIGAVEIASQGGLSATEAAIKDMSESVTNAIVAALKEPAEKIASAADKNVVAANTNLVAARTVPIPVTVNLVQTANEIGGY